MQTNHEIPVIDIFAGPGGLGEGFSGLNRPGRGGRFRIKLSIEMDKFAHQTLLLRSFFRQFDSGSVPRDYYQYLRGEGRWENAACDALLDKWPTEGTLARNEAWREELRPEIADDVDRRIGIALGPKRRRPPWVLVGGPPCQAYSLIGRARMLRPRGREFYSDKRHTLYREYLRLLAKHAPPVFIMENVKGLLSAKALSGSLVFEQIVEDLQNPPDSQLRYKLFAISNHESTGGLFEDASDCRSFIVEAERYGIPQARHRIIILGVLESAYGSGIRLPRGLTQVEHPTTCRTAIDDLPRLRSGLSRESDSGDSWKRVVRTAGDSPWLRRIASNGQTPLATTIRSAIEHLTDPRNGRGGRFVRTNGSPPDPLTSLHDPRLKGACNHEARGHRADDLHRYLFVSAFGRQYGVSPKLQDFPHELLPQHINVKKALSGSMFNDRFRVQLGKAPSTTVTSHISKDGHYFIHYDPSQCRSLTVREAARLQTFPDNYFFEGPRTEQYRQVGNAVPPLLARDIASIVADGIAMDWK